MTRRVTGTLIGPTGAAVASATLRFTALATSAGGVPQGVNADTTTNEAGVYDATLQAGYYRIVLARGSVSTPLGSAVVTDGASITLPGLLQAQTLPESTAENLISRVEALEEIPPGSGIESVVAGAGIDVDNTDPLNPVVSATGGEGGAVTSVNGETGAVTLSAADVGADPAGAAATATSTAAAALTAHEAAANPHPTYLTAAEGAAAFDALGAAATATSTAAAALTAHEAASNPHPTYLTAAEGNAAYDAIGAAATAASGAASALAAHVAAGDPHPGYLTAAEGNAAYAPIAHVGTGGTAHANAVAAGAAGFMTGADKTKLDGIATGATANAADSALRDRSTHTGTQTASTISDFASAVAATGAVTSTTVDDIVVLTQAAFDLLSPPVATTLYVVVG